MSRSTEKHGDADENTGIDALLSGDSSEPFVVTDGGRIVAVIGCWNGVDDGATNALIASVTTRAVQS